MKMTFEDVELWVAGVREPMRMKIQTSVHDVDVEMTDGRDGRIKYEASYRIDARLVFVCGHGRCLADCDEPECVALDVHAS